MNRELNGGLIIIKSTLSVDLNNQISKIDPRIWGSFTEHLGRCVYEGIYQPDHPTADEDGFRKDVIDAVKKLKVPLIRYPGGNFVSGYNWEDGIGPKDQRPKRLDLAWRSLETNQFGLHEFMKWCAKVDAKPDMAVNLGTRGVDEARNLVEYCNFPKGTYWSDLQRKNGAEKPFNIKVWSVGNAFDDVDYLSLHQYYDNFDDNLSEFLGKSVDFDRFITGVVAICDSVAARKRSTKQINLAFDEWNVWYHSMGDDKKQKPWTQAPHLLEDHYNFEDALLVGSLAITLLKHADRVKIGCLAQLINVIAPIMTNTTGDPSVWYQTIFYPFMQVSNFGQGIALKPDTDVPTYKAKDYEVPYTDSIATYNPETHETVVFIVNKSTNKVPFTLNLSNAKFDHVVDATQFAGYDIHQTNEDQSMGLEPLKRVTVEENQAKAELAPLSWNMIRISTEV